MGTLFRSWARRLLRSQAFILSLKGCVLLLQFTVKSQSQECSMLLNIRTVSYIKVLCNINQMFTPSWVSRGIKELKFVKHLWPESACKLYWMSNRRLSAKLVPTFADRGCHVVSMTSLRQYSRFSRPEPLLFLPSSSSIVLTRLSRPGSRPTTSQKIW
jgi:hypothetical protein